MQGYKDCLPTFWGAMHRENYLTGLILLSSSHTCALLHSCTFNHVLTWILKILCQIPATVASKLYPPRLWLAGAAIGWGVVSTLFVGAFD